MAQPTIQSSFNSGEWAPQLFSRVDVEKFHSGAALLRNFFVDYRGGASTRFGTKYLAAAKALTATRLISFQITSTVGYILEFGDFYIRFYQAGAQVLLAGVPYEIATPYAAADLALLKFAQNVDYMVLCHPSYRPQVLTFISATNWTIANAVFGTTVTTPTGLSASTTLAGGTTNYAYVVTAVDANGQESGPSVVVTLANLQNLAVTVGTNTITWGAVTGAASYNIYKANSTTTNPVPVGVPFGFIGNVTALKMPDSNITPDFSQSPPTARNPFVAGAGVTGTSVTAGGSYTVTPTLSFSSPTSAGTTATGHPLLRAITVVIAGPDKGTGYTPADTCTVATGTVITVDTVDGGGGILTGHITTAGSTAAIPANPVPQTSSSGPGVNAAFTLTWEVYSITLDNAGSGYASAPTITFSAGAATATATVGSVTYVNPSVPSFFQQRLVLAAPTAAPQTMFFSQTGNYFNFDVHEPIQDDDAITASIVSGQLNTIKSMVAQPAGLIVLTDNSSWLVNGGSFGSDITPAAITANAQSFNGANDIPPIIVVYDMLYAQSRGSAVRDSLYNFYANVYTGADISILASHLFFGYTLLQWAWAEEPFKVVWTIRNDGTLLSLTFLKEQEFVAWSHSDTDGTFESVATVVESTAQGYINGVYVVVDRTVNGAAVKYVERIADRYMPNGIVDAWCVDCGIQYSGAPATSFSGAAHLANKTVTGLADGIIIPAFTMDPSGDFTLATAASKVTVGIAFTPDLQTLPLDLGNPTVQSKQKKIPSIIARVAETLGLQVGTTTADLVDMKDLIRGNVGSMTNALVTDLVNGDAMTVLDSKFSDYGQYYFRQPYPYPATILGVFPEVTVGDTPKGFGLDKEKEAA